MDRFQLTSSPRSDGGKGTSRKLRRDGFLPAILYGRKEDPLMLRIQTVELRRILREHPDSPIVDLALEGDQAPVNTIVREVQRHPASGEILHVDFQRINLAEAVRVEVHVELTGVPAGVKNDGGILEHSTRLVEVMCLPADIPDAVTIDVSAMNINDSIHLGDVTASYPKLEFLGDPETTIAHVSPPTVEVEATPTDEAATAEPEIVKPDRKEEESDSAR